MEKAAKQVSTKKQGASSSAPVAHAVGRRKSSVARVWLRRGKGQVIVNKKPFEEYFDTAISRAEAVKPMKVASEAKNYDVEVNVCGGGKCAQADAIKLGISRALLDIYESLRSVLREHDLLTVDSRLKERKKYGQRGARRKFQFVKR